MKIALVIERMMVKRGGRETSTGEIASALARRDHEVTILCQRGSWSAEGVQVRPLGGGGVLRFRSLASFVAAVQREISEQFYDAVHAMLPIPGAHIYQPRGGTVPAQRKASFRRRSALELPAVLFVQSLNFRRGAMGRLERKVAADPNVLCLAVSEMVADEFQHYYERTRGVRVIYNGVEVPDPECVERPDWRQRLRFQLGVSKGDPVFLTVANNFSLKGVVETIAAFAQWYHSHHREINAKLVLVGRDLVEGYRRYAGFREVGSQVVFVPPTDEIFKWYAAADACILLSWYDPCSRVVLEAIRWGIPSITTIYNGASEVLGEGAGVVVSSPRDKRAVVNALDQLSDPRRRSEMSRACLDIADHLSVDRHVEELLSAYAEVAKRR
jgi:UDP-glucose:(heptosyl)LPS alpha-1,3-glucosyltransferase